MAFPPCPHFIPSPVRGSGAQNMCHLLPTYANKPLQSPLATVALTLHVFSGVCNIHTHLLCKD